MSHSHQPKAYTKAFGFGIGLNVAYVVVEAVYGLTTGSSALLADAGHNTSDILSLILAWVAIRLAQRRPTPRYTYGLRKSTILASLLNGMLIVLASGLILWDAVEKFSRPVEVPGTVIMIVAGIGVIINAVTALLFMRDRKHDINIRGAFLHMAADAGVSLAVVLGGLLINTTGANWIDPMLSLLVVAVILWGVWGLLVDSVNLALDAVPRGIDINEVRSFLNDLDRVEEVHDLHIWPLSTTETALTAHLVIPKGCTDSFIYDVREQLHEQFAIDHTTLQIEREFGDHRYRTDDAL